jgi:hypothetical protein
MRLSLDPEMLETMTPEDVERVVTQCYGLLADLVHNLNADFPTEIGNGQPLKSDDLPLFYYSGGEASNTTFGHLRRAYASIFLLMEPRPKKDIN